MTDLNTFINDAAVLLLDELPLQSLDSAVTYVFAYISNVGGWIPDDPLDPNGDGHPANSFTQAQVADAITTQEIDAVYDINFTITLDLNVQNSAKLTSGLSLPAAAASLANQVSDFVTNSVNNSIIPLRVTATSTQITDASRSLLGGYTTQAVRQLIASDIADDDKDVDFKGLALLYVRNTYGVDTTWNVHFVYTELNDPIAISIRKYTNTTYATLDGGDITNYVINVSPTTFQVVTGVIL